MYPSRARWESSLRFRFHLHPFQVAEGLQITPPKQFDIFLNDTVTKSVEGKNRNAVGFGADDA
jgi:hypothetical protein